MSTYRQKGTQFYTMDFEFQGVRIREATGVKTKTLADRKERARRLELEEGRAGLKKPEGPKLFEAVASSYLDMKQPTLSENGHRIETANHAHLLPVFGKTFVSEIAPEDIAAYQKSRLVAGAANKTVNLEIGSLRSVLIYCGQWSRVQGSQKSPKVKMLRVREDVGTALSYEQEEIILGECNMSRSRSLIVIVILALYTGARFGVIRKLQWKNVNFARRCLRWGLDKTVSGDNRIIPLARKAFEALSLWAEQFPHRQPDDYVFPSERYGGGGHLLEGDEKVAYDTDPSTPIGSIKTAWREAQKRAKVYCRIHDLRHTAVTRMLAGGIPLRQISEIVGWSASQEILMSRRYAHFNTEHHRVAVETIDGEFREVPIKVPIISESPITTRLLSN